MLGYESLVWISFCCCLTGDPQNHRLHCYNCLFCEDLGYPIFGKPPYCNPPKWMVEFQSHNQEPYYTSGLFNWSFEFVPKLVILYRWIYPPVSSSNMACWKIPLSLRIFPLQPACIGLIFRGRVPVFSGISVAILLGVSVGYP